MDLKELQSKVLAGEKFDYLFFWGHTEKSDKVTKACLSQWYSSPFTVGEITYATAEHWMMYSKAEMFDDHEAMDKILADPNPAKAKEIGRSVKNFDPERWNAVSAMFVITGNILKFSYNPNLQEFLLSTGDSILVEASPYDKIWGIGMSRDDWRATDPNKWKGENRLGFCLMTVRHIIRNNKNA